MNVPPTSGIRVPAAALHQLVTALFQRAGTGEEDARLMADLLVATDLRGVFSHGTQQTRGYVQMILDGRVNPRPNISVARQTTTTRVYDGDGGMGHWPCYQAAQWAAATANEHGTAAVTTRNHFHFGGAGKYTRMAGDQGCIGIALSSHRYDLPADAMVKRVGGASPFSIAIPAGEQPPIVIDMATSFLPWDEKFFEQMPAAYFKELGLAAVMRALGGVMAGIYLEEFIPPRSQWESNQGAFIAAFKVDCFMDLDEFTTAIDAHIEAARNMQPFPGTDKAELPGGLEWQREQDYGRDGIPVGDRHRESLEEIAAQLEVETPFAQFEHTRF